MKQKCQPLNCKVRYRSYLKFEHYYGQSSFVQHRSNRGMYVVVMARKLRPQSLSTSSPSHRLLAFRCNKGHEAYEHKHWNTSSSSN